MVRLLRVTVPWEKAERIASVLSTMSFVHGLERCDGFSIDSSQTSKTVVYTFKTVEKKTSEVLSRLSQYAIGTKLGHIDVLALSSTRPQISKLKQGRKRRYRMDDALAIDEIRALVDNQYHLTFDYLAFIAAAAVIAAVGLLQNSATSVVASMLVSPLMGPIVGMTFGTVVSEWKMVRVSFRNELIGIGICFLVGALVGFAVSPFLDAENDNVMKSESTEMNSRGTLEGILAGVFIAIPSGCGVGLGVTSDTINPLVGCAISAALLPPIVNSGLALCLGVMFRVRGKSNEVVDKHLEVGGISFILFLVNWLLIYVFALVIFRTKKLHIFVDDPERDDKIAKFETMTNLYSQQSSNDFNEPLLDDGLKGLGERQETYHLDQRDPDFTHTVSHISADTPTSTRLRMASMPHVKTDTSTLDLNRIISDEKQIRKDSNAESRARGSLDGFDINS